MRTRGVKREPGELAIPLLTKGRLASLAAVPICAYVGYNGMGKSAAAAAVAMQHADAGRPVLGTARLLDYNDPRPCELMPSRCPSPSHGEPGHQAAHPLWRPLADYRDLFTFRDGHVWADEATGIADARSHMSMPGEVADFLPRMRAKQVTFHWTTIHWSFADTRLRRVTWAALWATGLMPTYEPGEIWGRNRLFLYRLYDAKNLADDFDPATRDDAVRSMVRTVLWGPKSRAFKAYNSLEAVASLGGTDESGMCLECGGLRGKKRCPGHGEEAKGAVAQRTRRPRRRERFADADLPTADELEAALRAPVGAPGEAEASPRLGRPSPDDERVGVES